MLAALLSHSSCRALPEHAAPTWGQASQDKALGSFVPSPKVVNVSKSVLVFCEKSTESVKRL